jgi:predicted transport protein
MKIILNITLVTLLFFCGLQAQQSAKASELSDKRDTLYSSENKDVYVLGDRLTKKINDVVIKFETHALFEDFQAVPVQKKVKKISVDWNSNADAKRFRTRIKETCEKENVNFAGHYCFVSWGCGSECQASVVVDALTGKVYSGPMASLGYKFKANSRMIIANPPEDPSGYYSDFSSYSKPSVLIWDEGRKQFSER